MQQTRPKSAPSHEKCAGACRTIVLGTYKLRRKLLLRTLDNLQLSLDVYGGNAQFLRILAGATGWHIRHKSFKMSGG
jgi:hypothetical protein